MTDFDPIDWRRLLTADERAQMLNDIARVSLAVGAALFPGQPWQDLDIAAGSLITPKSPIERLSFIERALPLLAQAIPQIRCSPIVEAAARMRPVAPPSRAHRVTTGAILQAVRRGEAARTLDETTTTLTADTPENRAVKSFLRRLVRDCAAIRQIAEAEEAAGAAARAEGCARRIQGLLAGDWWEEVASDVNAWTKPPTQRAMARPDYAVIFRETTRYRAGFAFEWNHPRLTLPQRETWRLYETWCLFTTLDALRALGWTPILGDGGATPDLFAVREGRLTWTLAQGNPSRVRLVSPQGQRLSLFYNPTYAQGERSLSHTMQPDITLEEDGAAGRVWILDAKFKPYDLPGAEGDDINQMHAYRDAIVGLDGSRCVAHAWCLYAGLADTPNRARITYGRVEPHPSEPNPAAALATRRASGDPSLLGKGEDVGALLAAPSSLSRLPSLGF